MFNTIKTCIGIIALTVTLSACNSSSSGPGQENSGQQNVAPLLNQAAYVYGTTQYEFGYNSIGNIKLSGAPEDTDFNRWAMLHDGVDYRLYFFKQNSNNTLYQFAFNWSSMQYEYGYNSIAQLTITGAPTDADAGSFTMLHDGSHYRLYMRGHNNPNRLYQFAFNRNSGNYEYGYNSIPTMDITGAPTDTDWNRWAMLHDGTTYRLYFGKQNTNDQLYQFAYNSSTRSYQYGYNSIATLTLVGIPDGTDTSNFAMLHDTNDYRFYMQSMK